MKLNDNPRIIILKEFCSPKLCNDLIQKYIEGLERSQVVDMQKNTAVSDRTSTSKLLDNNDYPINKLLSSLSERLELSKANCEPVVFTQYLQGEEYKPHFDAFIKPSNKNQRTHTAILYLSKCIGGETFFDNLNITITPSIGDVCFFENCLANTDYINPGSLHSGLKVLEGTKYIMTFWFRRNVF